MFSHQKLTAYPQVQQQLLLNICSDSHQVRLANYKLLFQQVDIDNFMPVMMIVKRSTKDWSDNNLAINKQIITFLYNCRTHLTSQDFKYVSLLLFSRFIEGKFQNLIQGIITSLFINANARSVFIPILTLIKNINNKKNLDQGGKLLVFMVRTAGWKRSPCKQLIELAEGFLFCQYSRKCGQSILASLMEEAGQKIRTLYSEEASRLVPPTVCSILVQDKKQAITKFQQKVFDLNSQCARVPFHNVTEQITKVLSQISNLKGKQFKNAVQLIERIVSRRANIITAHQNLLKLIQTLWNSKLAKILSLVLQKFVESADVELLSTFEYRILKLLQYEINTKETSIIMALIAKKLNLVSNVDQIIEFETAKFYKFRKSIYQPIKMNKGLSKTLLLSQISSETIKKQLDQLTVNSHDLKVSQQRIKRRQKQQLKSTKGTKKIFFVQNQQSSKTIKKEDSLKHFSKQFSLQSTKQLQFQFDGQSFLHLATKLLKRRLPTDMEQFYEFTEKHESRKSELLFHLKNGLAAERDRQVVANLLELSLEKRKRLIDLLRQTELLCQTVEY